jgi:uncharacterized membrane protein
MLTRSGWAGAVIIGTTIFGFGGFTAGLLLIAFFVSSSLLSRLGAGHGRKQRAAEQFEKDRQRDLGQALANGGVAAVIVVVSSIGAESLWNSRHDDFDVTQQLSFTWRAGMASFVGAMATVTADTWATELGVLSKSRPIKLTTLRPVAPGTSGGVSLVGLAAALAGAVFMAGLLIVLRYQVFPWQVFSHPNFSRSLAYGVFLSGAIAGLLGSLFDSLLGATVQAMYYDERRQKETEKPYDQNGVPNRPLRGWRWLNNDWVNFISSAFGAAVAVLLIYLFI